MRQVSWVLLLFFLFSPLNGFAFDDRYPPFDLKDLKNRVLNTGPINKPDEKGAFRDKDLVIAWETKRIESSVVEVRYKSKQVVQIELPGKDEYSNALGEVFYADLDGNGLNDIIIHPEFWGSGLGSFYKTTTILFQAKPGQFQRLDFTSFNFDPRDLVDLKGDGKYELLIMQLADGLAKHNFWTYTPYRIENFNLVMDKKSFIGFPKFIFFTNKPNNQATNMLSQQQKDEYLQMLPQVIKSSSV